MRNLSYEMCINKLKENGKKWEKTEKERERESAGDNSFNELRAYLGGYCGQTIFRECTW